MHLTELAARVGREFPITVESLVKPRDEYRTNEYKATGQPCAPAVMVGDKVVVEGKDISDTDLIAAIEGRSRSKFFGLF